MLGVRQAFLRGLDTAGARWVWHRSAAGAGLAGGAGCGPRGCRRSWRGASWVWTLGVAVLAPLSERIALILTQGRVLDVHFIGHSS